MEFQEISKLAGLLAKSFAENFFRLLVVYKSISASEAASRLDLHIKTAQDFLEGLADLKIVSRDEVSEGKRPYVRYTLVQERISIDFDVTSLYQGERANAILDKRIREKKNAGAMFSTAGNKPWFSNVVMITGEGRKQKERRVSLTKVQGAFLYHLPFPSAEYASIQDIMVTAEIDLTHTAEIVDIVEMLLTFGVIEEM